MTDALHPEAQRIDQWLWFSRLAKSRTLAQALIERGKVRVNRVRIAKTSHPVKSGDVVTFSMGPFVRVFEIRGMGLRRGPAAEAAALYRELLQDPDHASPDADGARSGTEGKAVRPLPHALREEGSGRPTKRERRLTERLKSRFDDV